MRKGKILLVGDAAHVHSPAGGQGMNTGIQEPIELASVLKEALLSGNESALHIWEKKRLEIAKRVLKFTNRLTKIATTSSPGMQFLRNTALGLLGKIPYLQHALARKLSELDNR